MQEIVAFIGVIGSGKDYRAQKLMEEHPDKYVRVDFKDALLEMASDLVGYDVREDYEWFKRAPIGVRRPTNPLSESYKIIDAKKFGNLMTGRDLLQHLGTDVIRKRQPDYWADKWRKKASMIVGQGKSIVVADCRFNNEVVTIWKMWPCVTHFIFCDYHSSRYDDQSTHPSEALAHRLKRAGCTDGEELPPPNYSGDHLKWIHHLNAEA